MKAKQMMWTLSSLLLLAALAGCRSHSFLPQQADAPNWFAEIKARAEKGDAQAQCSLGICYNKGACVAADPVEAVQWYRKAAEQGLARAQCNLGICYENGEGVAKDAVEAVQWYRKAAEQGYADAQCNLGACYYNGEGVASNYVEAHKWFSLASAEGDEDAKQNLSMAERQMTTKQIAEAQQLAQEFKPRKVPDPAVSPFGQPPKP